MPKPDKELDKGLDKRPGKNPEEAFSELFPTQPGHTPLNDVYQLVDRDKIEPWPEQPRDHITPDQVKKKRDSISEGFQIGAGLSRTGIDMALIARPHPDKEKRAQGFIMLIEGELRWRGTEPDGKTPLPARLPVNVRDVTEEEAWEIAGISALLHEGYTPVQQMRIVQGYMQGRNKQRRKASTREAAERFGKSKSWVSDLMVIADPDKDAPQAAKELIYELQQMVSARADSLRHARELKKVADPEKRRDLIQQVIDGLSLEALCEIIEPKQKEEATSEVSARADTSSSSSSGSTNGSAAPSQQGSGFASGGSSDYRGGTQGGTSSRGVTLGAPAPQAKKDVVRDALRPGVAFIAEAGRLINEQGIAHRQRGEIEIELELLKKHIAGIEESL